MAAAFERMGSSAEAQQENEQRGQTNGSEKEVKVMKEVGGTGEPWMDGRHPRRRKKLQREGKDSQPQERDGVSDSVCRDHLKEVEG